MCTLPTGEPVPHMHGCQHLFGMPLTLNMKAKPSADTSRASREPRAGWPRAGPQNSPEISHFPAIFSPLYVEYLAEYSNLVECEWHSGFHSPNASGTRAATHRVRVYLYTAPFQAELCN